ncbi:MAG TPA: SpvB/TcaC N-terminal domain-containing protein [Nitrospiraceae bacterium]|nr:SpvB/TcaC N-terminal domain-containing protein [Nitrospiraceae bacterium]
MANKSNTAGQTISTPQGGGALHGIGETFSPDLHTGTGNFTVPIAMPPGRNGFQPQLSLLYSTGNGNGPYGLGWSLTIPGVSRKTSKGIPRYRNGPHSRHEGDTFLLAGAEDLIAVAETAGDYTLFFTAVRRLKARVYCRQRHLHTPVFDFNGLSLASNRRFDLNGTETTAAARTRRRISWRSICSRKGLSRRSMNGRSSYRSLTMPSCGASVRRMRSSTTLPRSKMSS